MAGEAHRGVVFTQKIVDDPSVVERPAALAERIAHIQSMLNNVKLGGLDIGTFQTSVDKANAALEAMHKRALSPINLTAYSTSAVATAQGPAGARSLFSSGGVDKVVEAHRAAEAKMTADAKAGADQRSALPDNVVRNRIAMLTRLQKFEAERSQSEKDAADKEIARLQKTADAEEKAAMQRGNANARAVDRFIADADKQAAADAKAAAQRAEANKKATDAQIAGWDKQEAADKKKEAIAQRQRDLATAQIGRFQRQADQQESRDADLAVRRQREEYSKLGESIGATTEAVSRLGAGMVYLGLIGERDLGKLTDTMLRVQGTVNVLRGGFGALRDIGALGRNLAAVQEAGGGAGVLRALMGLGPRAGAAGLGIGALPVAGGLAAAAGVAGIGAQLADMAHPDYAGFGHVGGAWDRVGTAGVGAASSVANPMLSILQRLVGLTVPFGATRREREKQEESKLFSLLDHPLTGALAQIGGPVTSLAFAGSRVAMGDRSTARQQAQLERDKTAREEQLERTKQADELQAQIRQLELEQRQMRVAEVLRPQVGVTQRENIGIGTRGIDEQIKLLEEQKATNETVFQRQRPEGFKASIEDQTKHDRQQNDIAREITQMAAQR
ncbi:MAG TPA: hypothetical protein VGP68_16760, partial [Gemmataceae bacterium]|nr:hypothetical protein [Gemmataceae bacterium]